MNKKQATFLAVALICLLPFQIYAKRGKKRDVQVWQETHEQATQTNADNAGFYKSLKKFFAKIMPWCGEESLEDFKGQKLESVRDEKFSLIDLPSFDEYGRVICWYKDGISLPEMRVALLEALSQNYLECGYNALYNASCLMRKKYSEILNKEECKNKIRRWKRLVNKKICIGSEGMETIIQKSIPELRKNNFSIVEDLDLIITSLGSDDNEKVEVIKAANEKLFENIKRFRDKQEPQVVVINDLSGDSYSAAQMNAGSNFHWFTARLEREKDGSLDVKILNSLNGDLRNHPILDKLVHLFVNAKM